MKKIFLVFFALLSFFVLSACNTGIPDDATVAVCPQGDTFKYIYKDDKVYEFYSNDELQSDAMLKIVQDASNNYDDFRAYLDATFMTDVCTFTTYTNTKE